MKYNKNDIITLENDLKYIVCDIVSINDINYLYLVNEDDENEYFIVKEKVENDVSFFESIKDEKEFEKVLLKLALANKNMINEVINNN